MKKILKTLWIAALTTLTKLLALTLTKDGFSKLPTLGSVPFEYLAINFLLFVGLTVLFIYIEENIPVFKLLKGVVFSMLVSIVWSALIFQPALFDNITKYLTGIFIFMGPMLIYGAFLGYLSTENKKKFSFTKKHLIYLFISAGWLIFHLLFMIFVPPLEGYRFKYILWLIPTSLIIGLTFGFFYLIHEDSKYNPLVISSIIVLVIFLGYYADRFVSDKSFEWVFFIRILLDVVSVILTIQVIELTQSKTRNNKKSS